MDHDNNWVNGFEYYGSKHETGIGYSSRAKDSASRSQLTGITHAARWRMPVQDLCGFNTIKVGVKLVAND